MISGSLLRRSHAHTDALQGANRGIGLNLARALAAQSWNVVASVRPQTKEANDPSVQEVCSLVPGPCSLLPGPWSLGCRPL